MMIIIDELKICLAKNEFCLIKKEEKFSTIPSKRQIVLNSHQIIQYTHSNSFKHFHFCFSNNDPANFLSRSIPGKPIGAKSR